MFDSVVGFCHTEKRKAVCGYFGQSDLIPTKHGTSVIGADGAVFSVKLYLGTYDAVREQVPQTDGQCIVFLFCHNVKVRVSVNFRRELFAAEIFRSIQKLT